MFANLHVEIRSVVDIIAMTTMMSSAFFLLTVSVSLLQMMRKQTKERGVGRNESTKVISTIQLSSPKHSQL